MSQLVQVVVIGNELALAFLDGEELYLPLDLVRRACPCATCQGEPDALGRVVRPVNEISERGYELLKTELIGGYAIQLSWADGHATGIYSFDYLKRLGALA